jgi:hypothetical protein
MINHILSNPLDPWSWIAILVLLFTVVLPLLVIIAVSILVILLFRKKNRDWRSDVSNQKPSSESKSSPEELKTDGD